MDEQRSDEVGRRVAAEIDIEILDLGIQRGASSICAPADSKSIAELALAMPCRESPDGRLASRSSVDLLCNRDVTCLLVDNVQELGALRIPLEII